MNPDCGLAPRAPSASPMTRSGSPSPFMSAMCTEEMTPISPAGWAQATEPVARSMTNVWRGVNAITSSLPSPSRSASPTSVVTPWVTTFQSTVPSGSLAVTVPLEARMKAFLPPMAPVSSPSGASDPPR